jgi:hypothetical protein
LLRSDAGGQDSRLREFTPRCQTLRWGKTDQRRRKSGKTPRTKSLPRDCQSRFRRPSLLKACLHQRPILATRIPSCHAFFPNVRQGSVLRCVLAVRTASRAQSACCTRQRATRAQPITILCVTIVAHRIERTVRYRSLSNPTIRFGLTLRVRWFLGHGYTNRSVRG